VDRARGIRDRTHSYLAERGPEPAAVARGLGAFGQCRADVGNARRMSAPRLPQGANGIDSYIPVARIADMLLPEVSVHRPPQTAEPIR
jgi:hypothetical protein